MCRTADIRFRFNEVQTFLSVANIYACKVSKFQRTHESPLHILSDYRHNTPTKTFTWHIRKIILFPVWSRAEISCPAMISLTGLNQQHVMTGTEILCLLKSSILSIVDHLQNYKISFGNCNCDSKQDQYIVKIVERNCWIGWNVLLVTWPAFQWVGKNGPPVNQI